MCLWGAPKIETPEVKQTTYTQTPEQKELEQIQLQLARENLALNKATREEEAASKAAFEEAVGMPYEQYMASVAKSTQDMNMAYLDRYQKALAGELEIDPGLERSLGEQEQNVRASMLKQLGPGWETSTPGQQALAEYQKRANELRYSARRGEISAGEQQGYAMNPMSWVPVAFQQNNTQTPTQVTDLLSNYRNQQNTYYDWLNRNNALNAQMKNINDMAFRQQLHEGVMFAVNKI